MKDIEVEQLEWHRRVMSICLVIAAPLAAYSLPVFSYSLVRIVLDRSNGIPLHVLICLSASSLLFGLFFRSLSEVTSVWEASIPKSDKEPFYILHIHTLCALLALFFCFIGLAGTFSCLCIIYFVTPLAFAFALAAVVATVVLIIYQLW